MIANLIHFLDGNGDLTKNSHSKSHHEKKDDGESKGLSKKCKIMTGLITALLLIVVTLLILFLVVLKSKVPAPPTSLTRNDALTDTTEVAFSWNAPTDDGGEDVIDYTV